MDKLESILKDNLGEDAVVFNAIGIIPQSSKKYDLIEDHYLKINQ